MSEIKNGRLGLYGAEHSKCDHIMTLGFKVLSQIGQYSRQAVSRRHTQMLFDIVTSVSAADHAHSLTASHIAL